MSSPEPDRSRSREQRVDELGERCRKRGLRLTPQRRVVLEMLLQYPDHPTADQIYEGARERLPNVSRTTIYRVLESFVRVGAISKACHPGRSARYDVRTDIHHHLVCLECDRMVDISDERLDALPVPDTTAFDFEVIDFRVQLRGFCRSCAERKRKEDSP